MNFHQLQPGAKRSTHLLLSAIIWSSVGLLLLSKAVAGVSLFDWQIVMVCFCGLVIGSFKSVLLLDKVALRIILRIQNFKGLTWLPAVYSLKTWTVVIIMMILGLFLKYSFLPTILFSFVYCAVGWGMFFSSRNMWSAFWKITRERK